jgi:hypothetical protein
VTKQRDSGSGVIDATLEGVSMTKVHTFFGTIRASPATMLMSGASPTTFFRVAQDFFGACESIDVTKHPYAFSAVASHCLEVTLKAYLLHAGVNENHLRTKVSHNLARAWNRCVKLGLSIPKKMPHWATTLKWGHDAPYLFRYAPVNSGIVTSPRVDTIDGLRSVMATVQAATGVS